MAKHGKKYLKALEKIDKDKRYELEDAIQLVLDNTFTKFDESVEVALRLGVDPRHADQMVRGSVILPNGTGKDIKVLVFAKGEKEKEAKDAGADYVGGEDYADKIQKGWLDFDRVIATPDMMSIVGKLGKILGPRGLMPNPKVGTVTFDIDRVIRESKAGKVDFRVDKTGIVHVAVGKVSFGVSKMHDNVKVLIDEVVRLKPLTSKGVYLKGILLSSTMGPGVKVDPVYVRNIR